MKKVFLLTTLLIGFSLHAQNVELHLMITGLTPNGGNLYINIQNEKDFAEKEFYTTHTEMIAVKNSTEVLKVMIPEDYYYIAVFQDTNDNGKLDTKTFGLPKEPVGISNYNFKSIPGGFKKHSVMVNKDNSTIEIIVKTL